MKALLTSSSERKGGVKTCQRSVGDKAMMYVLACLGCHGKTQQTEWLAQQKFILSQFQRLEIQDQGAVRVDSGETSLPDLWTAAFSLCTFSERERETET